MSNGSFPSNQSLDNEDLNNNPITRYIDDRSPSSPNAQIVQNSATVSSDSEASIISNPNHFSIENMIDPDATDDDEEEVTMSLPYSKHVIDPKNHICNYSKTQFIV